MRVRVHTPAKVNLSLEVLWRRPDGFHELETVMTAVSVFDTLDFRPHAAGDIRLSARWGVGLAARSVREGTHPGAEVRETPYGDLPAGPENIVWRAAERLRERAGITQGGDIRLVKRIPAAAGLGGASSDAAAMLIAANEGWGLDWSLDQLAEVAAEIGSDVPFFLRGRSAICRGRGEQIENASARRLHVVLVRPPVGLSTPAVFRQCRPGGAPGCSAGLVSALEEGNPALIGKRLGNRLQEPASRLTPWINQLVTEFNRLDCVGHQMSGSGSTYFGLGRHARHARRLASQLRGRQVGAVYVAETSGSMTQPLCTDGANAIHCP